jgi:hypothetical protein
VQRFVTVWAVVLMMHPDDTRIQALVTSTNLETGPDGRDRCEYAATQRAPR